MGNAREHFAHAGHKAGEVFFLVEIDLANASMPRVNAILLQYALFSRANVTLVPPNVRLTVSNSSCSGT